MLVRGNRSMKRRRSRSGQFPAYAETSPAPLSVAQTQALLGPDEALVSFISMGDKSYVFAVTREGNVWRQIPLGDKAIVDRVSKLRLGLFDPAPDATPNRSISMRRSLSSSGHHGSG